MNPAEQAARQAMEIPMEQSEQQQVWAALASQGAMIGRHEQLLQQILTQLQTLSLAPQPVLQPMPPAAPEPAPREPRLSPIYHPLKNMMGTLGVAGVFCFNAP